MSRIASLSDVANGTGLKLEAGLTPRGQVALRMTEPGGSDAIMRRRLSTGQHVVILEVAQWLHFSGTINLMVAAFAQQLAQQQPPQQQPAEPIEDPA